MDDFDRYLELQLRQMLDPVAAVRPPRRRGVPEASRPILTVEVQIAELAPEAIPVEPAVVMVPIAPASQL